MADVIIVPNSSDIVVTPTTVETIVNPTPIEVTIAPVGIQGIQGPAGAPDSTQIFTGQTSITVNHNRGYRPIVSLSDAAGNEIDAAVDHTSFNSFTVLFNVPQSGRITYF